MAQPNQQAAPKGSTAAGWIKWHAWNEVGMRPLSNWVCQAARVAPGSRVLDVGAGTGIPSLAIAALIRPGGTIIAVDHTVDMLQAAALNAQAAHLDNIAFRQMEADTLDFPDDSFDAVTSTFTLMFCPDPVRVVAEVRRVLKPGGRFAFAVWDEPQKNPFFTTTMSTVGQLLRLPPPDPTAPGPFRLASDVALSEILRAGGFPAAEVASLPFEVPFQSTDQHWEIFSDMMPALKNAADTLPPDEVAKLRAALREALAPYRDGDRVLLRATPLTATGRK
jgi:SAM-dependent methyltransferase